MVQEIDKKIKFIVFLKMMKSRYRFPVALEQ